MRSWSLTLCALLCTNQDEASEPAANETATDSGVAAAEAATDGDLDVSGWCIVSHERCPDQYSLSIYSLAI